MRGVLTRPMAGRLVILEPMRPEHEEGLFLAGRYPQIWRWMDLDPSGSKADFHSWFRAALERSADGSEGAFVTLDAVSGDPIGSTRYLSLRPEHRGLEIGGTWLTPSKWMTGANVEAKLLMLEHAFERLSCIRVEFKTDSRNERSRRALEGLPARFEGIFRKHKLVRGGQLRDSAYYSVIDDEWPAVRRNLERRLSRF